MVLLCIEYRAGKMLIVHVQDTIMMVVWGDWGVTVIAALQLIQRIFRCEFIELLASGCYSMSRA